MALISIKRKNKACKISCSRVCRPGGDAKGELFPKSVEASNVSQGISISQTTCFIISIVELFWLCVGLFACSGWGFLFGLILFFSSFFYCLHRSFCPQAVKVFYSSLIKTNYKT